MTETPSEFAAALHDFMHSRMDRWWPQDGGTGDGHRRTRSLNRTALSEAAHVDRNNLGQMLSGKILPEAHQLRSLLRIAGAEPDEELEWEARRKATAGSVSRTERSIPSGSLITDNFEVDGLFLINTWGDTEPLTREHSVLRQVGELNPREVASDLVESWQMLQARVPAGWVCSVSRIGALDWRETPEQSNFEIDVLRTPYALALAQRHLLSRPSVRERGEFLLRNYDLAGFTEEFPGCKLAVNVQVATADNYLVALRRSGLVHNYKSQWALSINETMKASDLPEDQEDLFDLVYRGLSEELHVEGGQVKAFSIEWIGACLDCGDFYVFVNARTTVSYEDLAGMRMQAHSRREHDGMMPLDLRQLESTDFRTPNLDGNRWLHHAPLAAHLGTAMLRQPG